jgi:hypothetical protein
MPGFGRDVGLSVRADASRQADNHALKGRFIPLGRDVTRLAGILSEWVGQGQVGCGQGGAAREPPPAITATYRAVRAT